MKCTNSKCLFLIVMISIGLVSCDLLDVNNPNSLTESSINNPASAPAMANGVEASLTRAVGDVLGPYSVASDEFDWVGSRDDWNQLDQGFIEDPTNEYVIKVFNFISESRYLADDYIERMEGFEENGTLTSNTPLIRVYLYGAIGRVIIADTYDNFVFSDKQDYGEPIGEENMDQLYDTAVEYANNGLALSPSNEFRAALLGIRARAKFSKMLWAKVNPAGQVNTGEPLVSSSEVASDARAALDVMDEDYRFELVNNSSLDLVPFDQALADQTNERLELRIGDTYVTPNAAGNEIDSVKYRDPIDDVVQPFLEKTINDFTNADEYANYTMVSAREMHLIIAETALANNNIQSFTSRINSLRTLDGLTSYNGQIPPREMLIHARQVHLFLQGRRLYDQYRFELPSSNWDSQSSAVQQPGTFLPISDTEIQNNPNL